MKHIRNSLLLGLLLPAFAFAAPASEDSSVTGNTAFALDLYAKLQTQAGNLFLSPYSISTALAMTYGGARGDTESQMAKALHFKLPQGELHPAFARLEAGLAAVQKKGKIRLGVANSLWPQQGASFLPDFLSLCETHYAANDLSMIVLLPRKADGLAELESKLTPDNLKQWTGGLKRREVEVFLPKFKLTSQFSLKEQLSALGMTAAFSNTADFSGMNGRRDLHIGAVIHKAFVEVNEEGTEAAAATAVEMRAASRIPDSAPVFRADHPFVFFIRDNASGSILFIGRLSELPEK